MVYNNVAIAESFKKSYGLNSLLQKRVTLKEEGGGWGGMGVYKKLANTEISRWEIDEIPIPHL